MELTYPRIGLHIDGQWIYDRPACTEIVNPSNESRLGTVPGALPEDLALALSAAQRGFPIWRDTPPLQRAQVMLRACALVRERAESIAHIITLENGKPIADARYEVARAAAFVEWDAAEAQRLMSPLKAA